MAQNGIRSTKFTAQPSPDSLSTLYGPPQNGSVVFEMESSPEAPGSATGAALSELSGALSCLADVQRELARRLNPVLSQNSPPQADTARAKWGESPVVEAIADLTRRVEDERALIVDLLQRLEV